jgi:polyvinyl alcohol dehydrogenase (cytochrome)
LRWVFHPPRQDHRCDFDFGASVNVGVDEHGDADFVGVGGKDGTYYRLDPRTGALVWSTNVVFGGFAGGFIATTAYDGRRVYGSTALGDYGRFESGGPQVCDPTDPRDTPVQEPSVHALDARTGLVRYESSGGASFGPTTVAGGMTFNCPAFRSNLDVRDARTGAVLTRLDLPVPCWSGIATVGDAIVVGVGTSFSDVGSGVMVFTPDGSRPATGRAGEDH